nr:hypothetical protein Itr_chr08CG06740 [Ipomoea trifida]
MSTGPSMLTFTFAPSYRLISAPTTAATIPIRHGHLAIRPVAPVENRWSRGAGIVTKPSWRTGSFYGLEWELDVSPVANYYKVSEDWTSW